MTTTLPTSDENEKPKLCADCIHLLGNRSRIENWEQWKCGAKQNIISQKVNLVSGAKESSYKQALCFEQRAHEPHPDSIWCGEEGKWYEFYEKPEFYSKPNAGIPEFKETFAPQDIESLGKGASERIASLKKKRLTPTDLNNL